MLWRGGKKLQERSERNQQKAEGEDFLPTNMVGDPPKNQAAKKQTKERRAANHSRHKRRQLHGGCKLNNGVTNDAENITVGQVRAESERSNSTVKTVKR